MTKIKVKSVEFGFSENEWIKEGQTYNSLSEASRYLQSISSTFARMGVHKTDLTIRFEDDFEIRQFVGLSWRSAQVCLDLGTIIKKDLEFNAGLNCPSHWSEDEYKDWLETCKIDPAEWLGYLDKYDLS